MAIEILLTGICILSPIPADPPAKDIKKVELFCPQMGAHKTKFYVQASRGAQWPRFNAIDTATGLDGRDMFVIPFDRIDSWKFIGASEEGIDQVELDELMDVEFFGYSKFCSRESTLEAFTLEMNTGSLTAEDWILNPEATAADCFKSSATSQKAKFKEHVVWKVEAEEIEFKLKKEKNTYQCKKCEKCEECEKEEKCQDCKSCKECEEDTEDQGTFTLSVPLQNGKLSVVISNDMESVDEGKLMPGFKHWKGVSGKGFLDGDFHSVQRCTGLSVVPICHMTVAEDRNCPGG